MNRPIVNGASYRKLWLRFGLALGWLLLAAGISFVPKLRRPAGEMPVWKLVVWLILFFALFSIMVFIWKGG